MLTHEHGKGTGMCIVCELQAALDVEEKSDRVQKFVEALIKRSEEQTGIKGVVLAGFFARHFQRMTNEFVNSNPKPNELAKLAGVLERLYEVPEESREFTRNAFDPKLN